LHVIVWTDDGRGERLSPAAAAVHPNGVGGTLGALLDERIADAHVTVSGLEDPEQGLPDAVLGGADALVWWAHEAHEDVAVETVDRVHRHVLGGLGLVVLHSAHHSKVFRRLMGTSCDLTWREADDAELIWTVDPVHPIAAGIEWPIRLERHEMYGEPFDIPAPDELVLLSAFSGGEAFRSGCCFRRGAGRIFYFGPGHETNPVYEHPQIRRVIGNAVRWAAR
jgi:trehalose utilization protein